MDEQKDKVVLLHLPRNKKIDIEFNDIAFTVSQGRKGKRHILRGVSGKFRSGELTAIMGPSGAGKTSLLNILTGFHCSGMKGSIKGSTCNKEGSSQYKKESCYILQDDQLAPFFTVSEIMEMAADLKLGQNLSKKAKQYTIDDILDTLGLLNCKNTRCSSLSGGQKKRLSIALELIDNPPIMFLDEPTTGLDSLSSLQCISMLKALARGGRTIICTIHQPSATIYEMFDYVYVLAEGLCIYQGASTNTVAYLSSAGLNCPEYHNPADYLLEVANGEYGNFTQELAKAASQLNWRKAYTPPKLEIEEEKIENGDSHHATLKNVAVMFDPPSEWFRFAVLTKRSLLQLYRDWTTTQLKLFIHILIGVFIGFFYFDVGNDASKTIVNFGYLLVTIVYLSYTSMMPAALKFPSEIPVLRKERFNNWYKLKTYYAAIMVVNIPLQILFVTTYATISYFMSAQPSDWYRYLMFLWMCWLITIAADSVGIFLGTVVNPINGTFLGAISVAFFLVLAGFLVFLTHMSKFFYIVSYFSFMRYAMQGLIQAIYGNGRGSIPCPDEVVYCHYTTPSVFLKEIGMITNSFWEDSGVLCAFIIILRITAFCTLRRTLANGGKM